MRKRKLIGKYVHHKDYGYGIVHHINFKEYYPIGIDFIDKKLDEIDSFGYFKLKDIRIVSEWNLIDRLKIRCLN